MNVVGQELAGLGGQNSTSAMSALGSRQVVMVVLVTGALAMPATSSNGEHRLLADTVVMDTHATNGGGAMYPQAAADLAEAREITRDAVNQLRRVSGLTWDQVSRLFDVSRRSVHFWASGKPMSSEHEEHLHRLLAMLRGLDSSADAIRGALLSVVGGDQVLETLAGRRYSEAEDALRAADRSGMAQPSKERTPLSAGASEARRPLPVDVLAAGEVRASHPIEGRGRAVRTARSKDRGQS